MQSHHHSAVATTQVRVHASCSLSQAQCTLQRPAEGAKAAGAGEGAESAAGLAEASKRQRSGGVRTKVANLTGLARPGARLCAADRQGWRVCTPAHLDYHLRSNWRTCPLLLFCFHLWLRTAELASLLGCREAAMNTCSSRSSPYARPCAAILPKIGGIWAAVRSTRVGMP